jgi:hypothetical protein
MQFQTGDLVTINGLGPYRVKHQVKNMVRLWDAPVSYAFVGWCELLPIPDEDNTVPCRECESGLSIAHVCPRLLKPMVRNILRELQDDAEENTVLITGSKFKAI